MAEEVLTVQVKTIANGFTVTEAKAADYKHMESMPLFYPTMEEVERELIFRLRAAAAFNLSDAKEDF